MDNRFTPVVNSKVQTQQLKNKEQQFYELQEQVEFEMHQFWAPHSGQAPVAYALFRQFKRYVFMQCGRKLGKTDLAIYCMYMYAILFPGSQIYYIADTMKHAGELVWKNGRLHRFFMSTKRLASETDETYANRRKIGRALHEKYIDSKNESEMRLTFKNGSFIKVDGAENYANADGIEPDFIVYDEFKHHDPRFNEAMEPNLRVKRAPLLIVGTPPEALGTYYEKIANSTKRASYGYFCRRPSYLNPVIYPLGEVDPDFIEECNKYKDRGEDDVLKRELYAEIVLSGSKAIFPVLELPEYNWDTQEYIGYSRHVHPRADMLAEIKSRSKDWDYFVTFDPGSSSCFAATFCALHKIDKRVYIIDEIYEQDQRETTSRKIMERAQIKWRDIYGYDDDWVKSYDYAAKWFENEIWDLFPEIALEPCEKDIGTRGEDKKDIKLSMIKDMMIHDKIVIAKECEKTIWEMVNYRKDDKGKIPKENDHLIDCISGDALISTTEGLKRMDSVSIGDLVHTNLGVDVVTDAWVVGERDVLELTFTGGQILRCTPDHRIYTENRGFVEARSLTHLDIFCSVSMKETLWKKEGKKFATEVLNSSDTQTVRDDQTEFISSATQVTSTKVLDTTTDLSMSARRGLSLKDFISITSTTILSTTILRIWKLFVEKPTCRNITKESVQINREKISIIFDILQKIGTLLKKAGSNTLSKLRISGLKWNTWKKSAPSVEKHMRQARIPLSEANIATKTARLLHSESVGKKLVYDLTTKKHSRFFANGILVHNCLRYTLNAMDYDPTFIKIVKRIDQDRRGYSIKEDYYNNIGTEHRSLLDGVEEFGDDGNEY